MKPIMRYYLHKVLKEFSVLSLIIVPLLYFKYQSPIENLMNEINGFLKFTIPIILPLMIYILIMLLYLRGVNQRLAGLKGEAKGQRLLKPLKRKGMVIFSNVKLPKPLKGELDFVIVGHSNLYILEIKNIRGTVYGQGDDEYLIRKKISKSNNLYKNKIYNPIRQVGTHVYKLSKYLKGFTQVPYIYGHACFTHDQSTIKVKGADQLFHIHDKRNLINDILSKETSRQMLNRKVIIECLEKISVKI